MIIDLRRPFTAENPPSSTFLPVVLVDAQRRPGDCPLCVVVLLLFGRVRLAPGHYDAVAVVRAIESLPTQCSQQSKNSRVLIKTRLKFIYYYCFLLNL